MIDNPKRARSPLARLGAIAVLISGMFVMTSSPASAFNCGSPGNYHDGYYSTPSSTKIQFTGVSSLIDVGTAKLCSGGTSQFSNVYVMLTSNPSSSNEGWAQAGYEFQPGKGIRDFAQTNNGGEIHTYYSINTLSTGTRRTYSSVINRACGFCIINSVGGRPMQTQYLGTQGWAAPFSVQYSGEARYTADDIAGTSTYKVTLANMEYQGSDYAMHTDPCSILAGSTDSTRWKRESVGCSEKNLWTDPTN